ncbi:E3 binding domain-containing protein [Thermus caldifontis]|uniref:E3 binding domain-containing protein n=1 Tax=Thermus caldifontis TaxID=1930763 RepID=UPI000DF47903|nr:E3 binding domain-containing protein [Thermus caldifontis]
MAEPKITPLARRLAEENGIDWRRLQGTGPDGTIVERDILAFLAKVMAGEVELPPMPEEAPPLPPEEELKRVQEVLDREGVDLEDVLPTPPKAPTLAVEEVAEEELDLEPALLDDLELDLEEDLLLAEEPSPAPVEEEAPFLPEDQGEEALLKPLEEAEEELEDLLLRGEEEAPPLEPLEALEELEEAPSQEPTLAQAKEEDLLPPGPPPAPGEEAKPPEPTLAAAIPPPIPAPGLPTSPTPSLRVYRLPFPPEGLRQALQAFQRVHGVPENPLPFLLKAAERALSELELPLRPLLGKVEGERVLGLRPLGSFLALFRQEEGEAGEGLLCFAGEEEVHTGQPSLFLSPEGLLAASGLEAPIARKLLERVALYLENPVLLL